MTIASSSVLSEGSDYIQTHTHKSNTIKCTFGGDNPFCSNIITRKIDENYRDVDVLVPSSLLSSDIDSQFCSQKSRIQECQTKQLCHMGGRNDPCSDIFYEDDIDSLDRNPFLTAKKPKKPSLDDFCNKISSLEMLDAVLSRERQKTIRGTYFRAGSMKKRGICWNKDDSVHINEIFSDIMKYDDHQQIYDRTEDINNNSRILLNSSPPDFHIQEWIHIEDIPDA